MKTIYVFKTKIYFRFRVKEKRLLVNWNNISLLTFSLYKMCPLVERVS